MYLQVYRKPWVVHFAALHVVYMRTPKQQKYDPGISVSVVCCIAAWQAGDAYAVAGLMPQVGMARLEFRLQFRELVWSVPACPTELVASHTFGFCPTNFDCLYD